ncbi:aminoglycoside phosphotransferase family protein, partial [Candidatus Gracilibacteria bacterium]|nr:aminoglycoside phosphotransferase family protein [Candidatus Gracilibacteria bacterium]
MLQKLRNEIQRYFQTEDIEFREITSGRTNTNFFLMVGDKEYFLRTNITKILDQEFGGKLEKEYQIFSKLQNTGLTAELIDYIDNGAGLQWIILEKLPGRMPDKFYHDQDKIFDVLHRFQNLDYKQFDFLEPLDLIDDFKNLIYARLQKVDIPELRDILTELTDYLFTRDWNLHPELSICHNDFRSDNILVSETDAKIIDLESCVIADRYIDPAEYYIGGVFWGNFQDETTFDYDHYKQYMDDAGYTDIHKQKYIFMMKFCSNFAWLS